MQLQRVCNHPELVAPRENFSSYFCSSLQYSVPSLVLGALQEENEKVCQVCCLWAEVEVLIERWTVVWRLVLHTNYTSPRILHRFMSVCLFWSFSFFIVFLDYKHIHIWSDQQWEQTDPLSDWCCSTQTKGHSAAYRGDLLCSGSSATTQAMSNKTHEVSKMNSSIISTLMKMPEKNGQEVIVIMQLCIIIFSFFFKDCSSRCNMGQSQRDVWLLLLA